MNHMKEVAKLLGVELYEEFKIMFNDGNFSSCTYHFSNNSLNRIDNNGAKLFCDNLLAALLNGTHTIVKIPKSILTEKEKKTLSGIIEPYKSQVTGIKKRHFKDFSDSEKENIAIYYTEIYGEGENIVKLKGLMDLPIFPAGKYYKNMEEDKTYTLEELGL